MYERDVAIAADVALHRILVQEYGHSTGTPVTALATAVIMIDATEKAEYKYILH